jgi:uroporphyrinogen-III synthase
MIPLLIPPLTGLQILVTRPALQAESLCQRIEALGGAVLRLPTLSIEPREVVVPDTKYDLLIFISSNAVQHGQVILKAQPQARIAAVGSATAHALQALGHSIDVAPEQAASSEALLAHPLLLNPPPNVLIVRGNGGRELLRDTLVARGSKVDVVEAYQRVAAQPDVQQLAALKLQLHADALDVISVTSVDILQALDAMLDADTRQLAHHTRVLLAGSARIASAARAVGWQGECVIASSPEDTALISALVRWHTRARSELLR